MELTNVMEWLLTKGFVVIHKDKPKFTSLFYKEYTGIEKGLTKLGTVIEPGLPVLVDKKLLPEIPSIIEVHMLMPSQWRELYLRFIEQAKVPRRAETARGDLYDLNKFSEDGLKAFQKALKEGYDYKVLLMGTTLYYNNTRNKYKKAIGNYMAEGHWVSDYETCKQMLTNGKDAVMMHLKEETKKPHDVFTIG